MLKDESIWIKKQLKNRVKRGDAILNLGSSTLDFSHKRQPYIEQNIFKPLVKKKIKLVHADLKKDTNIINADFNLKQGLKILRSHKSNIILCFNVLEHLKNITQFAQNIPRCLLPGGLLFISVPQYFPYHPDPIDNLFRPQVKDLKKLFYQMQFLEGAEIKCESLFEFESQHYNNLKRLIFWCRIMLHTKLRAIFNQQPSFHYFKNLIVTVAIFKKNNNGS